MDSHLPQKRITAPLLLPVAGRGGRGCTRTPVKMVKAFFTIFAYLLLDYGKRIHIFILLYNVEKNGEVLYLPHLA